MYHDIESTKLFNGEIDSILDLFLDSNVGFGRDSLDVRIPRRDQSRDGFRRLDIDIDQEDVRALRSEQQGRFQSNATVSKIVYERVMIAFGSRRGELRSSAGDESGLQSQKSVAIFARRTRTLSPCSGDDQACLQG